MHRSSSALLVVAVALSLDGSDGEAQTLNARAMLCVPSAQPVIMVLGTYHWANPNRDAVKSDYDDPRSARRQREVRVLLDRLKAFKPTKIAVEHPYGSTVVQNTYARFVAGEHELGASETDQIGFRLAKELGHSTLWPFDVRLGMDMGRVMTYAAANGQSDKVQAVQRALGEIGKWQAAQSSMTIIDALRQHNDTSLLNENQALYNYMGEIGKDSAYVGADMLVGWYERNLKMAMNLLRIASSPTDRVLVIVGSGHSYWLNTILRTSPSVRVESAISYLK